MRIVNAREVWRREDEDFSPWLVKNLELLDEILDTKLELIARETPVGPFFADLLCVDRKNNDSLVVIENQLGRSDHDHLGKLLTYAAGLQATTAIWIAMGFEHEHLSALAALNRKTNDLFRGFGVKLELKPMNHSKCLPTFTLVAGPGVSTQQRPDDRPSTSHNEDQQKTGDRPPPSGDPGEPPYWSAFREFWDKNDSKLVPHEQNKPNYFGFQIGSITGFWFAAWRNNIETQIAAKLFMHSTDNFDVLKAQQRAIASEIRELIDEPLEWDRHPNYSPFPQVGFYKRGLPRGDRSGWQNQFEWLLAAFENLDRVFGTRIADITRRQA